MTGLRITPASAGYVPPETLLPILDRYAARARITRADILGRSRTKKIAQARGEVMNELRDLGYSLPVIGDALDRDHTTVLHWIRKGRG